MLMNVFIILFNSYFLTPAIPYSYISQIRKPTKTTNTYRYKGKIIYRLKR